MEKLFLDIFGSKITIARKSNKIILEDSLFLGPGVFEAEKIAITKENNYNCWKFRTIMIIEFFNYRELKGCCKLRTMFTAYHFLAVCSIALVIHWNNCHESQPLQVDLGYRRSRTRDI